MGLPSREQVRDIIADVANPDGQGIDEATEAILALIGTR